jgi:FHA domain
MTGQHGRRASHAVILFAVVLTSGVANAAAEPSLFLSEPFVDQDRSEILLGVGALQPGPGRATLDRLRVEVAGTEVAVRMAPLNDLSAGRDAGSKPWTVPLSVAMVFFWGETAPQEILDGVPNLFRRIPANVPVSPLPYAEGFPSFVTPRTAANIAGGDLDTVPKIKGARPVLMRAVRFAAREAAKEKNGVRFLIIVTDGRDHEAGIDRARFFRLGAELRQQGLVVQVVAFPNAAEGLRNAGNAAALAEGAGGRYLQARTIAELPGVIEAASLAFLDMKMAAVDLPLRQRLLGGEVGLRVLALVDQKPVVAATAASIPGGFPVGGILLVISVGFVVAGVVMAFRGRRGSAASPSGLQALLLETQRLIRLGSSAERAVVELSRRFPKEIRKLASIDPADLPRGQFDQLRSRAGRAWLNRIQQVLSASDRGHEGEADLVSQLAHAISARLPAAEAAARLRARLPDRVWSAFARGNFADIARLLRESASSHPVLATPQARKLVLEIQDALCNERPEGISVGWLVRASGPGRRGETLRLHPGQTSIGRSKSCQMTLSGDPAMADRHAVISEQGGAFSVTAGEGAVKVEGERVDGTRALADGDTLAIGSSEYVFKSVAG